MKNSPLFVVRILFLFGLVVIMACESNNQAPSPTAPAVSDASLLRTSHGSEKALFQDNFSSGLGQWTLEGASYWSVPNGVLDVNIPSVSYTFARAIAGDESWTNYRFDFDVKGLVGSEKICYVRYHDETQGYMLNFRSAVPAEGDPGAVRLFRLNDQPYQAWGDRGARGGWDLLTAVPYLHQQGTWYHVTVLVVGPNITVSIDGSQVIQYVDIDAPVFTGRIGLAGFTGANFEGGQHVQFDNVQVERQTAPSTDRKTTCIQTGLGNVLTEVVHHKTSRFYGLGYKPVECGTDVIADDVWYKLYFQMADGSRLFIGEDHHPLTVPTSVGMEWYQHGDNGTGTWTFVIDGHWPRDLSTLTFTPDYNHVRLIGELGGPGGKITEFGGLTEF